MTKRKKTWLLVDTQYLCARAWHTTGGLQYEGEETGVAFGIIRDLEDFIELYQPSRVILAFDYGKGSIRKQMNPGYKKSRDEKEAEMTEEEKEQKRLYREQVLKLRSKYLPQMGFNNVIAARGYEADDIIAKIADELPSNVSAIIISADEDFFQCITHKVSCFNPTTKNMTTLKSFKEEWGIEPALWASVKALAGCKSDDVEGIEGIGNKRAAQWFAGTLKETTKAYQSINENLDIHNKNIDLVKLPLKGLELPDVVPDAVTEEKKNAVKKVLGIRDRRTATVGGFDL